MAAKIEFTAITANGEAHTRTTATMAYTHALAIEDGIISWHKTEAAALKAVTGRMGRYYAGLGADVKVIPVTPTAIVGKLAEGQDFSEGWGDIPASALAPLAAAKRAKGVQAELPTDEEPAADPEAEEVQTSSVPTDAEREAAIEREMVKLEAEKAERVAALTPVVNGKKVTKKQALGAMVHAAALALLEGELPEGFTHAEAEDVLRKWLQYIPTAANPGGWQPKA